MKCGRLEALAFQINNIGRLSGITAKTALTRLYFIYCVSHRFIMTKFEIGLICLIIGFFIRPFVDVTITIFRNAYKKYKEQDSESNGG